MVVEAVDIAHDGDTYSIRFDVVVKANTAKARALLTDYREWPRLSDSITESRLLGIRPDGRQRVGVAFTFCALLIFCRELRQVKDMETGVARAGYRAELVPGEGDFASGRESWEILPEPNEATRLRYRATLVLAFRLPPLIGPWLLKRRLHDELVGTATRVETLLAQ